MDYRKRHYVIMYGHEGKVLEGWLPNITIEQVAYAYYIEDAERKIVKNRHSSSIGIPGTEKTRAAVRNKMLRNIANGEYGEEYATETTP